ncbi:hypothetical protein [Bacillus sp. FJAT-22090]|uniref:hypothetical protein n=1 Tax=Bacillus sp. FJAT-22090 TaxID=1581038 RepID=UPI0011A1DFC9|nr:hypothetical protein [Bacillus sp. FJAT-22090]
MSQLLATFLTLTIFNFVIAGAYRLRYEREIKKKTVTSNQLDRLVTLEQIYTFFGIVCLVVTLIMYSTSHV